MEVWNSFADAWMRPWPWYVTGPLIGLTVPLLLLSIGKPLGVSGNLQALCSTVLEKTGLEYFQGKLYKKEAWNLFFAAGLILGGWIASHLWSAPTLDTLAGFKVAVPTWGAQVGVLLFGGFLVGFGTRWANGCTSGHSIMGLSQLQWTSLVATCSFFAGGLALTLLDSVFHFFRA